MKRNIVPEPSGWVIGDTPYEIIAGKKLGLKTIAVTWGDKNREVLQIYNPDFIVDEPKEILKIVNPS